MKAFKGLGIGKKSPEANAGVAAVSDGPATSAAPTPDAQATQGKGGTAKHVDLRKLRRVDLLELLMDQIRQSDEQEKAVQELTELTARLKDKLNQKDEQIERLKARLDAKDALIARIAESGDAGFGAQIPLADLAYMSDRIAAEVPPHADSMRAPAPRKISVPAVVDDLPPTSELQAAEDAFFQAVNRVIGSADRRDADVAASPSKPQAV